MITTVSFYATGLNETNFAIDRSALNLILSNNKVGASKTMLAPLPFGAVFNISAEEFQNYKTADYIEIDNEEDKRYGFINNFLQLANGNYAVSYTLDDWANYVLSGQYNVEFDGLTERANVPFLKYDGTDYVVDRKYSGQAEIGSDNLTKEYIKVTPEIINEGNKILNFFDAGAKCVVYFMGKATYNGAPTDTWASGTVFDYDVEADEVKEYTRDDSSIFIMVYDESGWNIPIVWGNRSSNTDILVLAGGAYKKEFVNTENIQKIIEFDYIPTNDNVIRLSNISGTYKPVLVAGESNVDGGVPEWILKTRLADIYSENSVYYKAVAIRTFSSIEKYKIGENVGEKINGEKITSFTSNYSDYIEDSLYKGVSEAIKITLTTSGLSMDLPIEEIKKETVAYKIISGTGETAILKIKDLETQESYNILSATGENQSAQDVAFKTNYREYRAAKISGVLGIGANTVATTISMAKALSSQNYPAVIGTLSGGVGNIFNDVQRLKTLSPVKQAAAANDYSTTLSVGLNDFYILKEKKRGILSLQMVKELERLGITTSMQFDEYLVIAQRAGFNFAAVKCSSMDIHGIPQQAARRISDALLAGVTLWHTQHPGDKRIVNYGRIQ